MRALPASIAALLVPLVAACSDLTVARTGLADPMTTGSTSLTEALPPSAALALLPADAGAVLSVTERREENARHELLTLRQTVTLAGEPTARGENVIRVTAARRTLDQTSGVTEDKIEAELAKELPDADMTITTRMIDNPSGPIGIATGRSADGARCVYAWQEPGADAHLDPDKAGLSVLLQAERTALSIRVRLCNKSVSEERMIAQIEGLTVRSDLGRAGRSARLGGRGVGVDALATAGYAGASPRAVTEVRPAADPFAPRTVAARTVADRPARTVEPRAVEARTPAAPKAAVARTPAPAAAPTPATPSVVANPIPLPSGG